MLMPRGAHVAIRVIAPDGLMLITERDLVTGKESTMYEMEAEAAEVLLVAGILDLISCLLLKRYGRPTTREEWWEEMTAMFIRVHDALPDDRK